MWSSIYLHSFPVSEFLLIVNSVASGRRLVGFNGRLQAQGQRRDRRRRDAQLRRERWRYEKHKYLSKCLLHSLTK